MNIDLAKKRASKYFSYHHLSLPVDVESLLNDIALVEEEIIPIDGDAICINETEKPHIIIKSNISRFRKRFTYAHEIGHIQIPSHIGMISCTTNLDDDISLNDYYGMESEANAFAAELLMPQHWLVDMISSHSNFNTLINDVREIAQVSFMAALYNLIPLFPANYMFYIENKIENYDHIKWGSNHERPLYLYTEDNYYDDDWFSINSKSSDEIPNDTMDVSLYIFKKILSKEKVQKIASYFTDKSNTQNICRKLVKCNDISFAHLFKDISPYLPTGIIIKITCNPSNSYTYIYAPDTYVKPPIHDNYYTSDEWCNENSIYHVNSAGVYITIDSWFFPTSFSFVDNVRDSRDSKTILKSIVYENYFNPKERSSILGRVNGIIGSLNGNKQIRDAETFYNILKQIFISRTDLYLITEHDDFNIYLVKKSKELYSK